MVHDHLANAMVREIKGTVQIIELSGYAHHVMLGQPMVLVSCLRTLLTSRCGFKRMTARCPGRGRERGSLALIGEQVRRVAVC